MIEAVGTQESTTQAINATRPGGHRFLPDLVQQIWDGDIEPGKVFDATLPLEQAPKGYEAMDERSAIKVMLTL